MALPWPQTAVIALAATGACLSAYFSAVYYGLSTGDVWIVPRFCRVDARRCRRILETPQARLFGVPNSVLGLAFYAGLIIYAAAGWDRGLAIGVLGVTGFTVVFGMYLVYVLIRVLHVPCPVCLICHGINLALLLVLAYSTW